jgi:hypothetical protein
MRVVIYQVGRWIGCKIIVADLPLVHPNLILQQQIQQLLAVDQSNRRRPTLKRRRLHALGEAPRRDDRAPHGVEAVQ